ncbi:MAG: hypothetical protein CSA15_06640 [Candidatus Delongbacteria bacterium]|nr:MAG: hypothetical protein CSA15_06640 [Candidatus Delongbacteria bacterium]
MKKSILYGAIFGLIAPLVGLFLGLQVLPILGDVLLLPFHLISKSTNSSLGNLSFLLKMMGLVLSMFFWAFIFWVAASFNKKRTDKE